MRTGIGWAGFIDRTAGLPATTGASQLRADGPCNSTCSTPYGQGHHRLGHGRPGAPASRSTASRWCTATPTSSPRVGCRRLARPSERGWRCPGRRRLVEEACAAASWEAAPTSSRRRLAHPVAGTPAGHRRLGGRRGPGRRSLTPSDDPGPPPRLRGRLVGDGPSVRSACMRRWSRSTRDRCGGPGADGQRRRRRQRLNPLLVEGQLHGGIGQGIGQALYEEFVYDDDGNPLTGSFLDYGFPAASEMPSFDVLLVEHPSPNNSLGVKGIAESGCIGATPAIQNAVIDAGRPRRRHLDPPLTPSGSGRRSAAPDPASCPADRAGHSLGSWSQPRPAPPTATPTSGSGSCIVLEAGVSGIYQIKRLTDAGIDAVVLEAEDGLGEHLVPQPLSRRPVRLRGTPTATRSPASCSTSGTGASGSPQPENLRYLRFVADKFDLERHMQFGCRVSTMTWDDGDRCWTLGPDQRRAPPGPVRDPQPRGAVDPGAHGHRRHGHLRRPDRPFHAFHWPAEPVPLAGRRVGVIGTGATGIQVIADIADGVGHLRSAPPQLEHPLNNGRSPTTRWATSGPLRRDLRQLRGLTGGFEHLPDRRGSGLHPPGRRASGRALRQARLRHPASNFPRSSSTSAAGRSPTTSPTSAAVDDAVASSSPRPRFRYAAPAVGDELLRGLQPRQRRAGRSSETPIERITEAGIQTTADHHDLDVIVYATGFDAITGGYDRIDICGVGGQSLCEKWRDGPSTFYGVLNNGFPNMFMVAGPQSVSGSTNFPGRSSRGRLGHRPLEHAREGLTRSRPGPRPRTTGSTRSSGHERIGGARAGSPATTPALPATRRAIRYQAYFGGAAHTETSTGPRPRLPRHRPPLRPPGCWPNRRVSHSSRRRILPEALLGMASMISSTRICL